MTSKQNLKSCKKDLDCDQNEKCELIYEKNSKEGVLKPKGRFCKPKETFNQNENSSNQEFKFKYSASCNVDDDCKSGLCEDTGGIHPTRMCIDQKKIYGKRCNTNTVYTDCPETGRCVYKDDNSDGMFCLMYDKKENF